MYREKGQECEAFVEFVCFFTFKIQCYSQTFDNLLVFALLCDYANTSRRGGGNTFTCLRC